MGDSHRGRTIAALGTAQTLAWGSSCYLPAMLATKMAAGLGVSVPTVFMAFSSALVISAIIGPLAGQAIDRWVGRPVLLATNVIFAAGLAGLHELMMISRELRHLIQTGARAEGMRTLRQDGIEKVLAGQTTIDEVRATSNV